MTRWEQRFLRFVLFISKPYTTKTKNETEFDKIFLQIAFLSLLFCLSLSITLSLYLSIVYLPKKKNWLTLYKNLMIILIFSFFFYIFFVFLLSAIKNTHTKMIYSMLLNVTIRQFTKNGKVFSRVFAHQDNVDYIASLTMST